MAAHVQEMNLDTRRPGKWRAAIGELVCQADISTGSPGRFSGKIRNIDLGCVSVLEIASDREYGVRARRHITADPSDSLVVVFVRSGDLEITQSGRRVAVIAGSFTIYDLARPYTYGHLQRAEILAVKVSATALQSRVGRVGRFLGQSYAADTGVGLLAVDFVAGMSRETGRIPDAATQSCGYQIVDLLGIALECGSEKLPIANSAARSALYQRCASFIRNEMANPDLDPQTTAEANGISTRYLHKIFQEAGQSFGEFLRSARLERCRRNLCDPGSSALPIGEIAYRAGFRSQSHFSKLFKKRFALSPADARAAACFAQE